MALQKVSLKSKDIITTLNYFETRTIRTVQLSPIERKNEKGNTNISVENNSNYCTIHKHNKGMFFMSSREVSSILMYPNQSEHLNERLELVSRCLHENKVLLQTLNSND